MGRLSAPADIIREILPKVFPRSFILYKIKRTFFPTLIIMPKHILRGKIIFFQKPGCQFNQRIIGCLRKTSILGLVTAFNGNGIIISRLYSVGDLIERNTLDNRPVKADYKMGAGRGLSVIPRFSK